jgi:pimeloyl-ACP methyl ester carboxylesterase
MEIDLLEPVQLGKSTQWIRHDQVAPAGPAERYAELLEAPGKQRVWFERSAHMPHLEEPGRFRELLAQVRLGLPAKT